MASSDREEKFYDCSDSEEEEAPRGTSEFVDAEESVLPITTTTEELVTEPTTSLEIDDPGQSSVIEQQAADVYAIDDTHLKELESLMNDEEKEEHHQRSLEIKKEGNAHFVEQRWEEAAKCYTRALHECPPTFADVRAIFYSNRAACFIKMEQNEPAVADCSKAIELDPKYVKAYFRRAQLYEMKEDTWDKALDDYQCVLRVDPNDKNARAAVIRLPPMIHARNERMKADMIDKLKDLGNMVLRPFGLSTENFKLEPNTEGGYSIQMKK